jgi:hypothetical protein
LEIRAKVNPSFELIIGLKVVVVFSLKIMGEEGTPFPYPYPKTRLLSNLFP